jgi:uncharacterized protein (DUF4213/DUF364 family)
MIAMAEHCLVSEDVELVDFGVLALPFSESFIEEAKFLINQALMDLMDNYQDFGNADEIYQLNLQLFPLTKL